jgi:hypothetical protein
MIKIKENYVTDADGKPIGVFIDIKHYRKLMKDLQAIRAYDHVKSSGEEVIPFDQAVKEIERGR